MLKFCINHKNNNPRKNEVNDLELVNINKVFRVLTSEEKRVKNYRTLCKNNTIREDTGRDMKQ